MHHAETGMWGYETTTARINALFPGRTPEEQEVLLIESLPGVKYADYLPKNNLFFLWSETAQTFPFEVACFKEGK